MSLSDMYFFSGSKSINYKKLINVDSDPIIHSQRTTAKEISRDVQKIICKRIHGTFLLEKCTLQKN